MAVSDPAKPARMGRRRFMLTLGFFGASAAIGKALWSKGQSTSSVNGLEIVKRTGFALGAPISLTVLHADHSLAEKALDEAFAELATIESVMSLYRSDSQISRLNRDGTLAGAHPYLVEVLHAAQAMSRASGGAFDVTVQPLWTLYSQLNSRGRLPTAGDVERIRRLVDWKKVEIANSTISIKGPGTQVTLNGIAQGFAVDRMIASLASHGVCHALIDTGELGAMGQRLDGKPWTIGIRHPRNKDQYVSRFAIDGRCVSTSGDYENSFLPDYSVHHIFDPRTGRSPVELASVTVVAKTGLAADALSTAVFVAGAKRGLDLVTSTPGADALCVMKDGKTSMTKGFPANLALTA